MLFYDVRDRQAHQEGDAHGPQGRREAARVPQDQAQGSHRELDLQPAARGGEDRLTENVTLNFGKIAGRVQAAEEGRLGVDAQVVNGWDIAGEQEALMPLGTR